MFTPTRFEHRFKADWVVPGTVLWGTCDRIDCSPDGRFAFVLDYKRSGRRLDREGEVYLQIPLYALMAGRELGAEPAGGAYLGVMEPDVDLRARDDASPYTNTKKGWLEPPQEWSGRVEHAVALAGEAVAADARGELPAPPAGAAPGTATTPSYGAETALRREARHPARIRKRRRVGRCGVGQDHASGPGGVRGRCRARHPCGANPGGGVQQRCRGPPGGPDPGRVRGWARPLRAAIDLSCAWVGTFHALSARIVRERAHAAGVAPDLVVLDELESRMLLELALDEAAETCAHPGVVVLLGAVNGTLAARPARCLPAAEPPARSRPPSRCLRCPTSTLSRCAGPHARYSTTSPR